MTCRAPGPRRAQQTHLAEPLRDGHRQRVEDQERSGEQRDRGDETGRGLEVGGRRTQRGCEVLWRGQHVRLGDQARLERRRDGRRVRTGGEADVDPAHAGVAEDRLRRPQRHDHRPAERPGQRSVAGDDPDDPVVDRVARPLHRELGADAQPVRLGQPLGDERAWLLGGAQGRTGHQGQIVDPAVDGRVDAEDGHRRRQRRAGGQVRDEVGAALERGGRDGHARACRRWSSPSRRTGPISPKAATRSSARPTSSRTVPSIDASMPALVASPANRTATPRATPRMLSAVRSGLARRLRRASPSSDTAALPTGRAARDGR